MCKTLFLILAILIICQAQNYKVATDPSSPPFEFIENGAVVGLDVDFLAAVAAAGAIQYELVQIPWAELFEEVKDAKVDLAISGITINDAREEIYDFSVPYYLSIHKILARKGTDITSAQDLLTLNKIVAGRNGTTGLAAVERILGADNLNIRRPLTFEEGVQALADGEVDAYVDDNGLLEYYAKSNPEFVVIEDNNAFEKELYGLMFPKGSELKALFDPAITAVLENGEYAKIYTQWLGVAPDVNLLLRAGEEEDPYDVFNEGEETELEWSNEEWDEWNNEALDIGIDISVTL